MKHGFTSKIGLKASWMWVALLVGITPTLMGARGCVVWAETNAGDYETGQAAIATLHNDTAKKAFLPGCATFNFEKFEDGVWHDMGPNRVCFWEGIVRRVSSRDDYSEEFAITEAGTWRLRYEVSYGCTEGEPMSQADCSSSELVYTDSFEVIYTGPTCEEVEAECAEMGGVFNPDACTCCTAGAHQIQECEFGQGGTFNMMTCHCDMCDYHTDCEFGYDCTGAECVLSECHDGDIIGGTEPARPCPDGYVCTFSDGVDLNHGNGWCEPE